MDEKFFRAADDAIQRMVDKSMPPTFGGQPGEPVPEVDPEDMKTIWNIGREVQARNPGQQVAIGVDVYRSVCKPGADVIAASYRASLLGLMKLFAPALFAEITIDGVPTDSAFQAAAKVPMEWMGVGIVRQGPPFDVDALMQLCRGEKMK